VPKRFTNWRLGHSLPFAGVSHRGLRGDYEQGKLPESGIECVFHEHARTNDCGGAPALFQGGRSWQTVPQSNGRDFTCGAFGMHP
jgi:hypothetical protein